MKILVFDDSMIHRDAAKAQLTAHDVTIVGTYDEAQEALSEAGKFDVVLTDLLVPASGQQQGFAGAAFVRKEMPVGIFIGLLAAVNAGAKYVAIFTDSDHHSHPASACFDIFNHGRDGEESAPVAFTVEDSKVLLCNNRMWVMDCDPNDLTRDLEYEERKGRTDVVRAKNWTALLEYLVAQ